MTEKMIDHEVDRKTIRLFLNATSLIFLFMFYASLLPYNVSSRPSDFSFIDFIEALRFSETGTAQGQWIAHLIFNMILTFLASVYCQLSRKKNMWVVMYGSILLFGFLIEYFQMFVGNRGTSMVDIYANLGGMFFGIVVWMLFGNFSIKSVKYFYQFETLSIEFAKKLYLAFVIVILLFPFDFFMNALQFEVAFATKGMPLFENDLGPGTGIFSIVSSMLLLFPLGIIYQMSARRANKVKKSLIINFALLLLFLEILQFFEISGQSSLPSFFSKILGFSAGLYFGRFLSLKSLFNLVMRLRIFFLVIFPLYIFVALKVKGADFGFISSLSAMTGMIENTSFLPFRYYIDVGSGEALLSFLLNFVIFIPIGGLVAIHYISKGIDRGQSFSSLATLGLLIALLLEAIVLFWGFKRPDVTNILVSAFALPLGYYFIIMIKNAVRQEGAD